MDHWYYIEDEAATYGTLSPLGFQTLMEFGDPIGDVGFTYEDMVMSATCAGPGYLLRADPRIGEQSAFASNGRIR